jgi:hypothetical protein
METIQSSFLTRRMQASSLQDNDPGMRFDAWNDLSDEIQLLILSFVATAPFESLQISSPSDDSAITDAGHGRCTRSRSKSNKNNIPPKDAEGTLVSVFPLVSRKFNVYFSKHETFWRMAWNRVCQHDNVWNKANQRWHRRPENTSSNTNEMAPSVSNHRQLYQQVFQQEVCFSGPVFLCHMQWDRNPHAYMEFMLFEPRYIFMLHELLDHRPEHAWDGQPLTEPCLFVHAYQDLQGPHPVALLVHVHQCQRRMRGEAYVRLLPVAKLRVVQLWEKPRTGHLYYAQGMRIQELNELNL